MFPINPCAHTIWAPTSLIDDPELSVDFYDVPPQLPLALKDTCVYEHTVCSATSVRRGRKKSYCTCSTLLTVVTFHSAPFAYIIMPRFLQSPAEDKIVVVSYTTLSPMLDTILYNLRNKVMEA
ncbi:Olfactory receptor 2L2 [Sciurus carolinensis]|uniref:Olfactory receptor 2L2 n=1 Tax=Sciurus carolinensis TaxID=30640 RepID=A0AA41N454_SCICA|nr:Olfactory receptor 2L2 [Sciurus carolinensis]